MEPLLTPSQIKILRSVFAQLDEKTLAKLIDNFYEKLFELKPKFKAFFPPGHFDQQKAALGKALLAAADNLDDLTPLEPAVEEWGRNHARRGVQVWHLHFALVALLIEVRVLLGEKCTEEIEGSFAILLAIIVNWMISGMIQAME